MNAYKEERFILHDPIIKLAAVSNSAFTWANCGEFSENHHARKPTPKSVLVFDTARDHGFTQGYVIPCHAIDKNGRPASALITLYWKHDPSLLTNGSLIPYWFRLAALVFHERLLELRGAEHPTHGINLLTERERECLVWACRGKTLSDTAQIICITERTVEFHIDNAMKKLGVYNKFHAVAVAIQYGMISP